jgi:predicted  nucleic acid-binding Zn-ribbon protein
MMASEPENLTLIYLRRIDEKVDRLSDDVRDLKVRMTAVEENLAGVQRRIDRVETRLERIERRLDLVDSQP